ncbi:MAG: L-2-hydroxyglutarate oxidase [bacterium]
MENIISDFLIIGSGIIGMSVAKKLKEKYPTADILIIEKEEDIACHSSGRNSGVLHAGFYYTKDSLKAKFTKDGNNELKRFCENNNLKINRCGKVVIALDNDELKVLYELEKRAIANNVEINLISDKELELYESNATTYKKALWSPNTATIDPVEILNALKKELTLNGVNLLFKTPYLKRLDKNTVLAGDKKIKAKKIINASGLYADKIAKDFGFSKNYVIIPFKGIYLKYTGKDKPIRTNIYPTPNLKNPFLGVHYTLTVDGIIKIGPTAIPVLWRENYHAFEGFKPNEIYQIISWETRLFLTNSFNFRELAFEEAKKYRKKYLANLAKKMVKEIDETLFSEWSKPGIRPQLLNIKTKELIQDFLVESDDYSVHILNAVSPAFTCSFPFAEWVVRNYL